MRVQAFGFVRVADDQNAFFVSDLDVAAAVAGDEEEE